MELMRVAIDERDIADSGSEEVREYVVGEELIVSLSFFLSFPSYF